MALTLPYNQGNPGNYKQSNLWDTPWAKEAWNNKGMANYAAGMGASAGNYLSGNSPLGRMATNVSGQSANYLNGNNPLSSAANAYGAQANNYFNGNNRVSQLSSKMGGYTDNLWNNLMTSPGGWGGSSSGGSWAGYGSPDDPRIAGHMANLRGNTYNLLDDYSKRAANAGVVSSRGGMGVAGGTPLDAQLRAQQMKQLSGQYGSDYSKAMDWTFQADSLNSSRNNAMASLLGSMFGTQMQGELGAGGLGRDLAAAQLGALANAGNIGVGLANTALGAAKGSADVGATLAGLQYKGLEGQNAWDLPLLMQRAQDYRTDQQNQMNWDQNEWKRQLEYKNAQQKLNDDQFTRDQEAYKDQLLKNFSYPRAPRDISPSWMGDLNYWLSKRPFYQGSSNINTHAIDPSSGMSGQETGDYAAKMLAASKTPARWY